MKTTMLAILVLSGCACPAHAAQNPAPGAAPGYPVARDGVRRFWEELKGDCAKPGADAADCSRSLGQAEKQLADADAAQKAGHGTQAMDLLRQTAQLLREALARSRRHALGGPGGTEAAAALKHVKDELTTLLSTLRRCCESIPGNRADRPCERSLGEIEAMVKRSEALVTEGKPGPALQVLKEAGALARRSTAECERLRATSPAKK